MDFFTCMQKFSAIAEETLALCDSIVNREVLELTQVAGGSPRGVPRVCCSLERSSQAACPVRACSKTM